MRFGFAQAGTKSARGGPGHFAYGRLCNLKRWLADLKPFGLPTLLTATLGEGLPAIGASTVREALQQVGADAPDAPPQQVGANGPGGPLHHVRPKQPNTTKAKPLGRRARWLSRHQEELAQLQHALSRHAGNVSEAARSIDLPRWRAVRLLQVLEEGEGSAPSE